MDEETIDNIICSILHYDGPDRHVDGHDVITDFIMALIDGKGEEWAQTYKDKKGGGFWFRY